MKIKLLKKWKISFELFYLLIIILFSQLAIIFSSSFPRIDYLLCALAFAVPMLVYKKVDIRAAIISIGIWDLLMVGLIASFKLSRHNNSVFLCFAVAVSAFTYLGLVYNKKFVINKKSIIKLFNIVIIFFCFVGLHNLIGSYEELSSLSSLSNSSGVRLSSIYTNRNTLATFMAIGFALAFYLRIELDKKMYFFPLVLFAINVLLTLSRASMLFCLVFLAVYLFSESFMLNYKNTLKFVAVFLLAGLIMCFYIKLDYTAWYVLSSIRDDKNKLLIALFSFSRVLMLYILIVPFFLNYGCKFSDMPWYRLILGYVFVSLLFFVFMYRFEIFSRHFIREVAGNSGRSAIWDAALKNLKLSPLFGFGPGSIKLLHNYHLSCHNIYIEQLLWGGAVYLLFNIYICFRLLKEIFKLKKLDKNYFIFNLAIFLAYLARGFFESNMFFALGGISNTLTLLIFLIPFAYVRGLKNEA